MSKLWFVMIFLIVIFNTHTLVYSQDKVPPAKIILEPDTTKNDTLKFLQKLVKPFKFKDNREKREQQLMYDFMMNLVKDGKLKIDSATVFDIMTQLNSLDSEDTSINNRIKKIIETNQLDKKASKEVMDSLKVKMSAVIQENANSNSQQKRDILNQVNDNLAQIRTVQYSASSNRAPLDSITKEDTLTYFRSVLKPKLEIIGWHNSWTNKGEFQRYNYNYLSALNLYGYELDASGKTKKPKYIENFQKPDSVIDFAQKRGCDVHLTVYSKLPLEIRNFLNNPKAQNTLIAELNTIIEQSNLKGITVYFEDVERVDSKQFVQFISVLSENLKKRKEPLQLNICIPAVLGEESLLKIGAYNFLELNPMVDHYLVLTDRLIGRQNKLAQATSPLYASDKYGSQSIENTINFYSNGKIPVSKLVLTVSYLGIKWNVRNFEGDLKNSVTKDLTYADIVKYYLEKKVANQNVNEGFDPDQASAFLNVEGPGASNLVQIWYDDVRSFYQKYDYALKNNLGGVSIRALGYDDGYSELWDILGGTLVEVDTLILGEKALNIAEVTKPNPVIGFLKGFKWNIFWSDTQWAITNDLWYFENLKDTCDCLYDTSAVDKLIADGSYWNHQKYGIDVVLDNKNICDSLYARWKIYSLIDIIVCIFFVLLFLAGWVLNYYFKRYRQSEFPGNKIWIKFALFLVVMISFIGWVWFNPESEFFTQDDNVVELISIPLISIVIGIFIGWILKSGQVRHKYVRKNLP